MDAADAGGKGSVNESWRSWPDADDATDAADDAGATLRLARRNLGMKNGTLSSSFSFKSINCYQAERCYIIVNIITEGHY